MVLFKQADRQWSRERLGLGTSTIGASGCLLCSLLMAKQQLLPSEPTILPPDGNALLLAAKAFHGSSLSVPVAAKALGLSAPDSERLRGVPDDRAAIEAALSKGACVLHVATDGGRTGRHFILALRIEGDEVVVADPALGKEVRLMLNRLTFVMWGKKQKSYRIVGVVPVHV